MAQRNATAQQALEQIYFDLNEIFALGQYNFTPTVVRPITQHNGIDITGTFIFNDISSERVGPMCYVTVRRDLSDPYPQNGFGFAFNRMNYSDTSSGIFNVYLVDNSTLIEDVFLYNNSILQENGVNNFLSAAYRELHNNTSYRFKLRIDEFNGMRLWLFGGNTNENSVDLDTGLSNSVYNSSTNYSGYIISSAPRTNLYEPQANGGGFGVGVLGTKEGTWQFDDLKIYSIINNYPFTYFQIKLPSSLQTPSTDAALLEWFGYGYWGDSPYTNTSGVQAWIQKSNLSWESVGSHQWMPGHSDITKRRLYKEIDDISNYRVNNYVNLYVTTQEAHNKAVVNTDYVAISTVLSSGIHVGNMLDIYVTDNTHVARGSVTVSGSATYYLDTATIGPILAVTRVTNYGIDMVEGDADFGYLVSSDVPSTAYSNEDTLAIRLGTSTDVVIEYLYYDLGNSVQTLVNSNSQRYPGLDTLVKINPPAIITINNLEYSGPVTADTMKTKIIEYVNSLDKEFSISKLLIYMQSVGATAFDLDTIDVNLKIFNYKRELTYDGPVTNTYVLSDIEVYFTDADELVGVIQI